MNTTVRCGARTGRVHIPASKSQAHRLLICAALGESECTLRCEGASNDITATVRCLNALGADIRIEGEEITVRPIERAKEGTCVLPCGESGSTLRFLLPLVGALGADAVFEMEGRLPQRPLAPLDAVLEAHGMRLERNDARLICSGKLRAGTYSVSGGVSSQYISGLLMALPRLDGVSRLEVTGQLESAPYVAMTEAALKLAKLIFEKNDNVYTVPGAQRAAMPRHCAVEGDWSNAAFFLCMGAFSPQGVTVDGLNLRSPQGDRAVLDILRRLGADVREHGSSVTVRRAALTGCTVDAREIPDLIPVLSVTAATAQGETRIVNAARLRLKESDRLASTARLITALGGDITELEDGLIIRGVPALAGGTADACRDHRIAMSAAVAASVSRGDVAILGSDCAAKSYPGFWDDFDSLEVTE